MEMPSLVPLAASDYRLDQITVVANWRCVLWTGTQHVTRRVWLIALATNTVANESGMLVGLTYDYRRGWEVADLSEAYCGLLPPDGDLVPFEADNPCGHTPPPGAA